MERSQCLKGSENWSHYIMPKYVFVCYLSISINSLPIRKEKKNMFWKSTLFLNVSLRLQTGGLPLLLHNPSSWHTAVACWLDSSLKPSLHSYITLLPNINSLPQTEPFPGDSGIPQDTAEEKKEKAKGLFASGTDHIGCYTGKKTQILYKIYPIAAINVN